MTSSLQVPTISGPTCCPDGLGKPIDRDSAEELAALLKAVADPARLQIIALLRGSQDCEACVCDLTQDLGLSQPTVSHHLKILVQAGIVGMEKRGYWNWYRLTPERLTQLATVLM